jgi:hypothetical protein
MPVQSGDQLLVKVKGSTSAFRETVLPLVQLGLTIANIAFLSTRD